MIVGRFIGAGWNDGATLNADRHQRELLAGTGDRRRRCSMPGGQSRSDAVAARSTLVTVTSSPGRVALAGGLARSHDRQQCAAEDTRDEMSSISA